MGASVGVAWALAGAAVGRGDRLLGLAAMLSFERQVVTAMTTAEDPRIRDEVVEFAGRALGAMPEFLRAGITAITIAVGGWCRARRLVGAGRTDAQLLSWLEEHPVGLVRQWARALRSLVLFAEQEKLEAASSPGDGAR